MIIIIISGNISNYLQVHKNRLETIRLGSSRILIPYYITQNSISVPIPILRAAS